jgi:hypothetical protein
MLDNVNSGLRPYSQVHVWILEESRPLTIFEMPWVGKFLGHLAYILKLISVGLCSHIICVQATFELCWLIMI